MPKSLREAVVVLGKVGRKALQPYMKKDYRGTFRYYNPIINRTYAKQIRNLFLTHGQEWPYEDVYPGLKHDLPPVPGTWYEKARIAREQRIAKIKENMKDMDQKIQQYRNSRKVKNVPLLDQLTMRKKAIRMKYLRTPKQ